MTNPYQEPTHQPDFQADQQSGFQTAPASQPVYQGALVPAPPQPHHSNTTIIMPGQEKSLAVGLLLTFFFGGFGLFYSTVSGALIFLGVCFVLGLIIGVISVVTFGIALFLYVLLWLACIPTAMVWSALSINSHNAKVRSQAHAFAAHMHARQQ